MNSIIQKCRDSGRWLQRGVRRLVPTHLPVPLWLDRFYEYRRLPLEIQNPGLLEQEIQTMQLRRTARKEMLRREALINPQPAKKTNSITHAENPPADVNGDDTESN